MIMFLVIIIYVWLNYILGLVSKKEEVNNVFKRMSSLHIFVTKENYFYVTSYN